MYVNTEISKNALRPLFILIHDYMVLMYDVKKEDLITIAKVFD